MQAHAAHPPHYRAPGAGSFLALQLPPHMAYVDLEVLVKDTPDFAAQDGVAADAGRRDGGIAATGGVFAIGRRGDRRHLADRLDPVDLAAIIDERDQGLCRRSSSAGAKISGRLA